MHEKNFYKEVVVINKKVLQIMEEKHSTYQRNILKFYKLWKKTSVI